MSKILANFLTIPPHISDFLAIKRIENYGKPESGLVWLVSSSSRTPAGSWAGHLAKSSSQASRFDWQVRFEGRSYLVSRVVYFIHTGTDPQAFTVDHKDRNTLNNNTENLRLLDYCDQTNNQGIRSTNKSGARGVSFFKKGGYWQSQLTVNGVCRHLGSFKCKIKAALAYNEAVLTYCSKNSQSKINNLEVLQCSCPECLAKAK
jgi:hypothetical protein